MKDIWISESPGNNGIRLCFSKGFEPELKSEICAFVRWIRRKYRFPVRLKMYVKFEPYVVSYLSEEKVSATIFLPDDKTDSPFAQISVGNYVGRAENDRFNAVCDILYDIASMITHYFQWLNDETNSGELSSRQAHQKARRVVYKYIDSGGVDL